MVIDVVSCSLCGLSTAHLIHNEAGDAFCCPACREVSALLAISMETAVSTPRITTQTNCETTTLSLGGLWCPSCAWLIHEGLRRSPGVAEAEVSFIQREARVSYDPAQVGVRELKKRIRRFGYHAWQADETPHDEEDAHWIRLLVTGVITMHVMVLSFMLYLRQWTGRAAIETEWLAEFFELMILVLSVPVVLMLGFPILRAGLAGLMRGRPSTHTLIAIGSFSAFALSLRNFIVGSGGIYFDTAAILLFLVALGRWFEMQAQKVSGEAVEKLWQQIPQKAAWMKPDGSDELIAADKVPLGARVRVRPGERFPVDAMIARGSGDIDESVLTGEPAPVVRGEGDRVLAGTVSLDGAFEVITTAVGAETVVGQIGRLLHQALWQRAPVERLADKLAAWMVPTAVTLAAATFAFWTWWSGVEAGLVFALSVLLIACPCALGIATPLTLWLGLGQAAEAGIILRNTGVLEKLNQIDHVFFDKTGTITKRPIRLQSVAVDGVDEETFLRWVTAVEILATHPLSQAIVTGTQQRNIIITAADRVAGFAVYPGQGVSGLIDGEVIIIGNRHLMAANELLLSPELQISVTAWQTAGLSVVYAGWGGAVRGLLGLGEEVREETAVTLQELTALQIQTALLTGDDAVAGHRWQQQLNIPVHAELHPEDKVAHLQAVNGRVAMIGDGINDSPALATATVGIAVSQGTDIAHEAADAILLTDDLRTIPWMLKLSHTTMQKVRQNLAWAFVYNIIGVTLAMAGLLQPAIAALFMVLSNIIVTTNALRLKKIRFNL